MADGTKITVGELVANGVANLTSKYKAVTATEVANGIVLATSVPEKTFLHVQNTAQETKATLTTSLTGDNNDLVFTSKLDGALGNAITVEYVDPDAADAELGVAVSGTDITISLATGNDKAISTKASDIATAVAAHDIANALVGVTNADADTGAGTVTAMTKAALKNGKGANRITIKSGIYQRAGLGDLVVDVAGESEVFIGPFESMRFEQADETLYIDIIDATTIKIGAILIPRGV